MLLYSFLLLIAVSVLVAIANWRSGILMMVLIAALQDPVRKLVPGTSSLFVLSCLPIWFVAVIFTFMRTPGLLAAFREAHRRLSSCMKIFVLALIPAILISLFYGAGSWKFTILGLFAYGGTLTGWLMGFMYVRDERDITRLMTFYCIVTVIMLTGTYIEHMGLAPTWSALGTEALNARWIRYTDFGPVNLYSGFYRSPDVMGWHAVMSVMFSMIIGIRVKKRRFFWFLLAAFAIGAAILCGRRKMFFMLPIFAMYLSWLYWRTTSLPKMSTFAGMIIFVLVCGYTIYAEFVADAGIEKYYSGYFANVPAQVKSHGIDSVIETFRQSGFFGEGLGFAVQGSYYIQGSTPRVWQEGGLEKILVELGVPGFLAFLLMVLMLFRAILRIVLHQLHPNSPSFPIFAGISAIVTANAGSFIVSHQIFGDPFIMTFFSFLVGILLSAGRENQNLSPSEKVVIAGDEKKYPEMVPTPGRQFSPHNGRRI